MIKVYKTLLILFVTLNASYASQIPVEVENYDLRYYNPSSYGLKDLVFEIRVKDLAKKLNKQLSLGPMADVYYKVYWMKPGKYKITIAGLPKGFRDIKTSLKNGIKDKLDFVIPQKMSPRLRSYSLKRKSSEKGISLEGVDNTHTRAINKIQLDFHKNGKLKVYRTFSPSGVTESLLNMSAKSWSHNKWLIDRMEQITSAGKIKTSIEKKVKYISVDGFGFPKNIKITTEQKGLKNKENVVLGKLYSEFDFSNYEVNTGKAKQFIMKGKR